MAVKAEATSDNAALKLTTTVSQDGYTVVVRGDGRLEAGQKITLTVDALFVGERILEQIIAHNTGMDANIALCDERRADREEHEEPLRRAVCR